jgi:drug/metabolite transporter (DMT)-like permease
MDVEILNRKRKRAIVGTAVLGLTFAIAFAAYFNADPPLSSPAANWLATAAMVLCPGSLVFLALGWIDAEPQTGGFVVMWALVALMNFAFYGGIGMLIGRLFWKTDQKHQQITSGGGSPTR